jgi:sterol desaturase/sphingolipid hydroxylase (fatty acid hydroxylase superfamily)
MSDTLDYKEPISWLLDNPAIILGIFLWLFFWTVIEYLNIKKTNPNYQASETLKSLKAFCIVGIAQVVVSLLLTPVLWLVYPFNIHWLTMDLWWHWLVAWLFVDFIYYFIHRGLHMTKIGWSLHAPHHSIPQLTVADSLRISWGEQPVGVLLYGIPLTLAGVPPYIAGFFYIFVSLYQYAIHTEINWSLGPLNKVIYFPAAHRSHHSTLRNEADKNYGGFIMLYDRLFDSYTDVEKTYQPKEYGLPSQYKPKTVSDIVFNEMKIYFQGLQKEKGLWRKCIYSLTPPEK